MNDVNKEILKLKALINNKQNISVFANKSNESSSVAHDDMKLYVNDMNKKFTFAASGVTAPITVDPRTKTLSNVEYIDDVKISDLTTFREDLDAEIENRIAGDEALDEAKADKDHDHEISDVTGLQTALDNKSDINHTHSTFTDITVNTINGCSINDLTNNGNNLVPIPCIPTIRTDGCMEVGKYIDMHTTYNTANDYAVRLEADSGNLVIRSTSATNTYINPLQIFNSKLGSGHEANILIGKASSARQSGYIGFCYHASDPYMSIGMHSENKLLNVYKNRVESKNNITAPNLKSDNETRLASCENLITTKADSSMLTALTARVAIVETDKADANHNHDTAYAAINHNHDERYVKTSDVITQVPSSDTTESLTYVSYEQDTSSQGAGVYPDLTFYTTTTSNNTGTIDINDTVLQQTSLLMVDIYINEQRYRSSYTKSSGSVSNSGSITGYTVNVQWTLDNNHLTFAFTVTSELVPVTTNVSVEMFANGFGTSTFTYTYVKDFVYVNVLNTNTTVGSVIADIAPKATLGFKTKNITLSNATLLQQDLATTADIAARSLYFNMNVSSQSEAWNVRFSAKIRSPSNNSYDVQFTGNWILGSNIYRCSTDALQKYTNELGVWTCVITKETFNSLYDNDNNYIGKELVDTVTADVATFEVSGDIVKTASADDSNKFAVLKDLIDLMHPVGSIYTSMYNIDPSNIFPNTTWTQITDRFLYCANSAGTTGGSKTITEANLPAHSHTFTGNNISGEIKNLLRYSGQDDGSWTINGCFSQTSKAGSRSWSATNYNGDKVSVKFSATPSGTISSSGSGQDYMPPYLTIFAWYRTA